MYKIFKYPIDITDYQLIPMHEHPEFLSVQMQNNIPTIWALVDLNKPFAKTEVFIYGTGHTIEDRKTIGMYLGTVQDMRGLVWHVFVKE